MSLINTATTTSSGQATSVIQSITSSLVNFLPLLLIFVVFYFLVIRPQDKKRKQHELLITSLKKGEQIITHSGIYGAIQKLNDDGTVELEISKNTIIKISKNSILTVLNRKEKK